MIMAQEIKRRMARVMTPDWEAEPEWEPVCQEER